MPTTCRQIAVAMQNFHDLKGHQPQYHAAIPPASATRGGAMPDYSYLWPGPVWSVLILPHLEETALYDAFEKNAEMKHAHNAPFVRRVVSTYICPSAESSAQPVFTDCRDGEDTNPNPALGLYYPVFMGPTQPTQCRFCPVGKTGSRMSWVRRGGEAVSPP